MFKNLPTYRTIPQVLAHANSANLLRCTFLVCLFALISISAKAASTYEKVYLAGTFNNWKNYNQLKSDKNDDTYTGSVYLDATEYEFKIKAYKTGSSTTNWLNNITSTTESAFQCSIASDANVKFTCTSAGTYNVKATLSGGAWKITFTKASVNHPTGALADYTWGDNLYVTGTFGSETLTTTSGLALKKSSTNASNYSATKQLTAGKSVAFQVYAPSLNYEDVTFTSDNMVVGSNTVALTKNENATEDKDKTLSFTAVEGGYYKFSVNIIYNNNEPVLQISVTPTYYTLTYYNGDTKVDDVQAHAIATDGNNVVSFSVPTSAYISGTGMKFDIVKNVINEDGSSTPAYYTTETTTLTSTDNSELSTPSTLTADASLTASTPLTFISTKPFKYLTVVFNITDNTVKVRYMTQSDVEKNTLYLNIRDYTKNSAWKKLAMRPSRNRIIDFKPVNAAFGNSGDENFILQNINLKADDLSSILGVTVADDDELQWYVQEGNDASKYYYPSTRSNMSYGSMPTQNHSDSKGGTNGKKSKFINSYNTDGNCSTSTTVPTAYYTFTKNIGVSYTFMGNKAYDKIPAKVAIVSNKSITEDAGGYYLIGNFTNAKGNVAVIANKGKKMTRYRYYGGAAYTDDLWASFTKSNTSLSADSVVYRAHVEKPTNGWGDLYIAVVPGSDQSWENGNALRPQINADYNSDYGYQIDGSATAGGLTTGDRNQSLNPNLDNIVAQLGVNSTDEIGSYEFSMNISTTTYRLIFQRSVTLQFKDLSNGQIKYNGEYRKITNLGDGNNTEYYRYYTTFCSMIAYTKPDYVDAFVVDGVEPASLTSPSQLQLTKLTTDYIPANTGLILAMKNDVEKTHSNEFTVKEINADERIYHRTVCVPLSSYTTNESATYNGRNYLTPLYDEAIVPKHFTDENGEQGTNYMFGYYRNKYWESNYAGEANDFSLGFWLSLGNTAQPANVAYIHLSKRQCGTANLGVEKVYNNSSNAKAMNVGGMLFEINDNAATGINNVNVNTTNNDVYYTLSGTKINKPTQTGIYIHNGKKIIIK